VYQNTSLEGVQQPKKSPKKSGNTLSDALEFDINMFLQIISSPRPTTRAGNTPSAREISQARRKYPFSARLARLCARQACG